MHRLALKMGRTVAELNATLTIDELAHWFAFDRSSPIGDERMSMQFAHLCLTVCQVAGVKKKTGGPFTLDDFLLFKPSEKPKSTLDTMRGWFAGSIKRKAKK